VTLGRSGQSSTGTPEATPRAERPPRPALVELAAALLIVGGFTSTAATLGALFRDPTVAPVLAALTLTLSLLGLVLGFLIRTGRAWLVTLNVVAIEAFLELTSFTGVGLLLGLVDAAVVVMLLATRPWFQWPGGNPTPGGDATDDERD
jgi:hypothetical protein